VITITDLKETELRALRLAMNKLGEESHWASEELSPEYKDIFEFDSNFDIKLSGFEMREIDPLTLGGATDEEDEFRRPRLEQQSLNSAISGFSEIIRSSAGTLAIARVRRTFGRRTRADCLYRSTLQHPNYPPYNIPIEGNVSGLGVTKHSEFAMASGERSDAEYTAFLRSILRLAIRCSANGATHFVCIDWRGLRLMLEVTDDLHTALKKHL
jgi:hypothetical protein